MPRLLALEGATYARAMAQSSHADWQDLRYSHFLAHATELTPPQWPGDFSTNAEVNFQW